MQETKLCYNIFVLNILSVFDIFYTNPKVLFMLSVFAIVAITFSFSDMTFSFFLVFLEGIDSKLNDMIGLPTKYYIQSIKIFRSLIILIWNFLCTSLQRHCFHSNHLLPFTIPYHFQSQKLNKADRRLV